MFQPSNSPSSIFFDPPERLGSCLPGKKKDEERECIECDGILMYQDISRIVAETQ
jgi:hypothetical protein